MKYFRLIFLVILLSVTFLIAENTTKMNNFTLDDTNGKDHSLYNYQESKLIVIIFMSTRCPVSTSYTSRMVDLYQQFKAKNITFLGINSNHMENMNEIKQFAHDNDITFPVLKDTDNKIADQFKAKVTPEVFVLTPDFKTLYHGRIDDSKNIHDVKSHDLQNTLNEYLQNGQVSISETKSFGCSIKRIDE